MIAAAQQRKWWKFWK
ncbi:MULTISPECIES: hypothetical protein [Bacillus]|nr:hypothetical protein [Bacillus pumilus]